MTDNPSKEIASAAERRRMKRQSKKSKEPNLSTESNDLRLETNQMSDARIAQLMMRNEDELLNFVAQVNKVYQEKLKRPAPFMTFVICGMQSAGKSTIMERFMDAVLNIVQEGTGTRCPLDTTCIHDDNYTEPSCELSGEDLGESRSGENLTMSEVFERITEHNKMLGSEDRFSTNPLYLVYRSKHVQSMRFVDTPGIISNKSTGKDNREEIKNILNSAMSKPNTKLCVLLEPKEFATNPIIEFCDQAFGKRERWINDATFLMTKFDKQLEDSRTGGKANMFFKEFHGNKCFPHLVITPTLEKEDLPADKLFKKRKELLASAGKSEEAKFNSWLEGHEKYLQQDPTDELLDEKVRSKIGFKSAKKIMREIMLEDTAKRLPEVLSSLRQELATLEKEEGLLKEKQKFNNPAELKSVVTQVLWHMQRRIEDYLDGDLESSIKFPEKLQTLEEEIDEEDDSEWSEKPLNHYTESEDEWRDRIADFEGDYPDEVQAENKFLGGKQVQRAIEFFRIVMIDALPDPYELKDLVPNGTGYLAGGLQRENWERAMVQITKVCVKKASHPGINYLIKHIGNIFRRLFNLALEDCKQGERFSSTFKLIPQSVERYLVCEFDDMLWNLMKTAADKTHCSLEPMYSMVDPNLPTFHAHKIQNEHDGDPRYVMRNGAYVRLKTQEESSEESMVEFFKDRLTALMHPSGEKAKEVLKRENMSRATRKKYFLPDERTSMITNEETDKILRRSFEYIVALTEFNLVALKFQLNHYLFFGFREELSLSFSNKLVDEADWEKLVSPDPYVKKRLSEINEQIQGIKDSLQDVQQIQRKM